VSKSQNWPLQGQRPDHQDRTETDNGDGEQICSNTLEHERSAWTKNDAKTPANSTPQPAAQGTKEHTSSHHGHVEHLVRERPCVHLKCNVAPPSHGRVRPAPECNDSQLDWQMLSVIEGLVHWLSDAISFMCAPIQKCLNCFTSSVTSLPSYSFVFLLSSSFFLIHSHFFMPHAHKCQIAGGRRWPASHQISSQGCLAACLCDVSESAFGNSLDTAPSRTRCLLTWKLLSSSHRQRLTVLSRKAVAGPQG